MNITIDTDISYFIENNHYHSYTFPIQNADDSSLVRNLLFSLQSDGSYKTILITYDLTELEKTKIRNNEFVDFSHPNKVNWQEIDVLTNETFNDDIEFNDGLFYDSDGGYCYEILRLVHPKDFSLTTNLKITVDCPWDGEMDHMDESIRDGGRGSGGNSDNGDEGEDPNTSGGQSNSDENGNNTNPNNENSDETPNNGNEHNQNDDCLKPGPNGDCQGDVTTIILPVDDEEENKNKECKKITDFLANNPNFKQKLVDLSSDANLSLTYEKGAGKIENQTNIKDYEGSNTYPEISVTLGNSDKLEALAHNHPTTTPLSLSTFSPSDLIAIAKLIRENRITDDFIAFLTTKQGTQYAITISDSTKFLDFLFYKIFNPNTGILDVPPSDHQKYWSSKDLFTPLYKKYFNPDFNPKIKGTNPNDSEIIEKNENDLKEFLNFMDEANAGFNLFETDNTFNTFTKLKLKNGETERETPCN
ncbi:hypothetical protein CAP47_00005 [Psychroflexus sp. S27]|uniref:hypothetical protein n=1 Tax=Psychroflexus sp. S27 TaxID=1982757 RepID=UPI000C2A12E7|nr:hypothetical protein [Psychroflexus sp. S27]PJX28593.1 hypothetical protein CAP47_00005 [Psychroflexus sp. S27]